MSESKEAAKPKTEWRFRPEHFQNLPFKPLHLDLHVDVTDKRVICTLRTTFRVGKEPISQVELDSQDLEVRSVEVITKFEPLKMPGNQYGDSEAFVQHVQSFEEGFQKPLAFKVDTPHRKLAVTLDRKYEPDEQFVLRTVTLAVPTENILEGLYFDRPIPGKPPTLITQCQQYGFQRIVPCVDRMAAKTFYTTTIVADAEYSNIISNGDLAPAYENKETGAALFQDVPEEGEPADVTVKRKKVVYYNHKVCMSSYLFFMGVGTYVTYTRKLEYPNGDEVILEILVFPDLVSDQRAFEAMEALHNNIMWCHTHTGPEQYEHHEERKEMSTLLAKREALKAKQAPLCWSSAGERAAHKELEASEEEELKEIRQRLKELIGAWKKPGYKYTGQVYREIAMENSDYGGMENVGNTTILSSRLVPSEVMSDGGYLYMEGVKIHEFYHNINGSEVTGVSPFNIWLNEAVTVHVQRQREEMLFGADFMRLQKVMYAFTPAVGPLAQDLGPTSMSIEPEGFNRTQELITAMTYSKAPEFTKMVETVITPPVFNRGLDLYHTKFQFSNAVTQDWIDSMVEASGDERLYKMARQWLKRTGHPIVSYSTSYDEAKNTFVISLKQTGFEGHAEGNNDPWIFPVAWALVKDGKDLQSGTFVVEAAEATIAISDVHTAPDFCSFARSWSFFGRSKAERESPKDLFLQALGDNDAVNRYFAYRALADAEKKSVVEALLENKTSGVGISNELTTLHQRMLQDSVATLGEDGRPSPKASGLTTAAAALILQESDDISSVPELSWRYKELRAARNAFLQAVWDRHGQTVLATYQHLSKFNKPGPHLDGIAVRKLLHHCLKIMNVGVCHADGLPARTKSAETMEAEKELKALGGPPALARQLLGSTFMSDREFGLAIYLNSDAGDKAQVAAEAEEGWTKHPDSTESLIGCISAWDGEEGVDAIRKMTQAKWFKWSLAGHARTLARAYSSNRKLCLLDDKGRALLEELFTKIGKVNQMSAAPIVSAFCDVEKFSGEDKDKLVQTLKNMQGSIDKDKEKSLYDKLAAILGVH